MVGELSGAEQRETIPSFTEIPFERVPKAVLSTIELNANGKKVDEQYVRVSESAGQGETTYAFEEKETPSILQCYVVRGGVVVAQAYAAYSPEGHPNQNLEQAAEYKNQYVLWGIKVQDGHQKKGIGTRLFKSMHARLVELGQGPLWSDFETYNKGPWGDGGSRTWQALKRDGLAKKHSTAAGERYVFANEKDR